MQASHAHGPASEARSQDAGAHFIAPLKPASQRAMLVHMAKPQGLSREILDLGDRAVALGCCDEGAEPPAQFDHDAGRDAGRHFVNAQSRALVLHYDVVLGGNAVARRPFAQRRCASQARFEYTRRANARRLGHDLPCVAIRANVLAISFASIMRPSSPPNPGLESRKSAWQASATWAVTREEWSVSLPLPPI